MDMTNTVRLTCDMSMNSGWQCTCVSFQNWQARTRDLHIDTYDMHTSPMHDVQNHSEHVCLCVNIYYVNTRMGRRDKDSIDKCESMTPDLSQCRKHTGVITKCLVVLCTCLCTCDMSQYLGSRKRPNHDFSAMILSPFLGDPTTMSSIRSSSCPTSWTQPSQGCYLAAGWLDVIKHLGWTHLNQWGSWHFHRFSDTSKSISCVLQTSQFLVIHIFVWLYLYNYI